MGQLGEYGLTSIGTRIRKNLNLLTLEGQKGAGTGDPGMAWTQTSDVIEAVRPARSGLLSGALLRRFTGTGAGVGAHPREVRKWRACADWPNTKGRVPRRALPRTRDTTGENATYSRSAQSRLFFAFGNAHPYKRAEPRYLWREHNAHPGTHRSYWQSIALSSRADALGRARPHHSTITADMKIAKSW
jgi:hypothetical protein